MIIVKEAYKLLYDTSKKVSNDFEGERFVISYTFGTTLVIYSFVASILIYAPDEIPAAAAAALAGTAVGAAVAAPSTRGAAKLRPEAGPLNLAPVPMVPERVLLVRNRTIAESRHYNIPVVLAAVGLTTTGAALAFEAALVALAAE